MPSLLPPLQRPFSSQVWLPGAGCSAGSLAGAGFDWFMCTWQGQLFPNDCYHWEQWGLLLPLPALSVVSFSSIHGGVSLHVRAAVRGDWVSRTRTWNCCWISQFCHILLKPFRSLSAWCSITCQHKMNAQVITLCMVKSCPKWSQWELPVVFHEGITLNFSIFKSLSHFPTEWYK